MKKICWRETLITGNIYSNFQGTFCRSNRSCTIIAGLGIRTLVFVRIVRSFFEKKEQIALSLFLKE